jgi:hypothetical protein
VRQQLACPAKDIQASRCVVSRTGPLIDVDRVVCAASDHEVELRDQVADGRRSLSSAKLDGLRTSGKYKRVGVERSGRPLQRTDSPRVDVGRVCERYTR